MDWIENLKHLDKNDFRECPYCSSPKIKSNFQKCNDNMGYGDVWCENCNHAFHISRLRITDELFENNSDKPHESKY